MTSSTESLAVDFQKAFGRVAATVAIIAVEGADGDMYGMTATAVCSLSNDPPSLVALVNQQNQTFRAIQERGRFAINFLSQGSEDLANQLAKPGASKRIEPSLLEPIEGSSIPALSCAVATLVCELEECIPQYTHGILVGRITHAWTNESPTAPLLYAKRSYHRLDQTALDDLH
ncbi:flavin reductase family protein [Arthrobacter sp. ISL-5]|uniref:flavin reductase family protein n=1 Tax=Arthrobacter sp. ISL-5 TaxID=2819111 RepID=UPI001BE7863F|nr:flavin reductase family protein [Arthrobacter sp. ISL-5]MBT2554189.1 flavin reductase family protein [Arthrobacter sp. ISL-5]